MKALLLFFLLAFVGNASLNAQNKNILINGKVISFEESFPIEGASVMAKGTKNQTGTQADGSFTLALESTDSVLVISYDGCVTQELKINKRERDYNVILRRSGNFTAFEEEAFYIKTDAKQQYP